jgi:hypothetical protein
VTHSLLKTQNRKSLSDKNDVKIVLVILISADRYPPTSKNKSSVKILNCLYPKRTVCIWKQSEENQFKLLTLYNIEFVDIRLLLFKSQLTLYI